MRKLNATTQGLITGLAMIAGSMLIYRLQGNFDNNLQYIVYAMYIAGIIWAITHFKKHSSQKKNFKNYFSQGFKCFIVVTLLMVGFTWIFMVLNPGMEEEMAVNYRADLEAKKNYTAAEIDSMVAKASEYFTPMLISMAIFGYLIIGALVTVVASLVISKRERDYQTVS